MYLQFKRAFMALCLFMTCMITFAQKQVTGSVTDPLGKPLIGVSVVVEGSTIGTVTDVNGNFSLSRVPENASIRVSYLGFREQTMKLGAQSNYYITMHEDNQNLDELVVIGYQSVKKRDLTGAVASLKEEDLEGIANANALIAMQAKLPGINITQSDGQAGGNLKINLRGTRSILADNAPLIIVDGADYGSAMDISANDIESIDVLKDAASTAIYGTRGANGVIIITTKRGKAGKTRVNLNAYNSWNTPAAHQFGLYGADEVKYRLARIEYANNYQNMLNGTITADNVHDQGVWHAAVNQDFIGGKTLEDKSSVQDLITNGEYTNWDEMLVKNTMSQNYDLSISGGSERTNFNVSLNMMNDNGLLESDNMKRYNGKINVDHKVNDWLKIGSSLFYNYEDQNKANSSMFTQMMKMTTITHAYNTDGTINRKPDIFYPAFISPLADRDDYYQNGITSNRFFGNFYADLSLFRKVNYHTQIAIDTKNGTDGRYIDFEANNGGRTETYIENTNSKSNKITWDNTLKYNTNLSGTKNDITVLLGHELIQYVAENNGINGNAGQNHYITSAWRNPNVITSTPSYSGSYSKKTMLSFFGRVLYSYADKYLLSATLRTDGASQLATGHKWATFPSVSAGWRITEEPWMIKTSGWLSNLKLRASWGITGNPSVDAYSSQATLETQIYSYGNKKGYVPSKVSNPDLTWEKTTSFDLGLDFGFMNGRLNGSIDFYTTKTTDLLYYDTAPESSVYPEVIGNIGQTSGNGLEFALSYDVVRNQDFVWNANLSYTYQTDKLDKMTDGVAMAKDNPSKINKYFAVGEPVRSLYDYKVNGTWAIGEYEQYIKDFEARHMGDGIEANYPAHYGEPGTYKIADLNDDGMIDSDHDRKFYQMDPNHILGMTNNFTYKNLNLSITAFARFGGYMRYKLGEWVKKDAEANIPTNDYWTPDNQHAKWPSLGLTDEQISTVSANYNDANMIESSDFFKIKDITLGYNLPKNFIKKLALNKCYIYGSLKNYFTFSKVDNYDSERGGEVTFPLAKQAIIGLNVEF